MVWAGCYPMGFIFFPGIGNFNQVCFDIPMQVPKSFTEEVAMKFRLYSGLFFDLPFENVGSVGNTLPFFTSFCKEALARGDSPAAIVEYFFFQRLGIKTFDELKNHLFAFMRLAERQIVLFDAVEDAAFHKTRDLVGPGTITEARSRIQSQGLETSAQDLLRDFGVRIVLTAHPTQFYTEQILGIIAGLCAAIRANDVIQVNRLLIQLGRTRFKKRERPSPLDEAKAILWFMENILYEVIPEVQSKLYSAAGLNENFMPPQGAPQAPPVELGFWPGGDRDGNPNVTTDSTRTIARLLHVSILRRYLANIKDLRGTLTFDGVYEKLGSIEDRLHQSLVQPCRRDGQGYQAASDLLGDLQDCRESLVREHQGLFVEELDRAMQKVRSFGFHFAIMDLRQDSRVLARAGEQVLRVLIDPSLDFMSMNQSQRMDILFSLDLDKIHGHYQWVLETVEDPVLRDCLEVFLVAQEIQDQNGAKAIHRFIVSNTSGPADLMTVRLLAVCAGYDPSAIPLDFVPLFETVEDLRAAVQTMGTLWTNPAYKLHIQSRQMVQHIMLGFSDGTKDGGYLSANWNIYRAKQGLTELARSSGVRVVFFDGRGGPPARGGGNTHKFYRSLGRDIEGRHIHLTIQGQTISSTYGTKASAGYNLEQLASAALDNYLYPENMDWHINQEEAALLDELTQISQEAYIALRNDEDFLPYIEELSPLRFYAQANISSRPTKRPGSGRLKLADLRAIPFVGAWSQLKQNIPGYYGLGTALETLESQGRMHYLQVLYQGSLYFRTLVENSMQSLSKVNLNLTAWVARDPRFARFHRLIQQEADRTVACLLKVSGQGELLEDDPLNRASIRMREDMILPISVIQQYALIHLRRLRDEASDRGIPREDQPQAADVAVLEKMVIKTMAACVNASRNSV